MVACDVSSEEQCPGNAWFHWSCVNLNQTLINNIEKFICNHCSLRTGEKTIHKTHSILTKRVDNQQDRSAELEKENEMTQDQTTEEEHDS